MVDSFHLTFSSNITLCSFQLWNITTPGWGLIRTFFVYVLNTNVIVNLVLGVEPLAPPIE